MKRPLAYAALAAMWGSALAADAAPALGLRARNLTSTTSWVSTSTQGMPLKQNVALLGAMPASSGLHVLVGLALPNRAAAEAYVGHLNTPGDPLYRHFLAQGQFSNSFAPSPAAAQAVANYLKSAGLSNVTIATNRLYVSGYGNAATVGHAFNTSLDLYGINGRTYFANATSAQVPTALDGLVSGITGLTNLTDAHLNMQYSAGLSSGIAVRNGSGRPMATCQAIPPTGFHLNPAFFTQFGLPAPPVTGVDFPTLPVTSPVSAPVCVKANIGPLGYQKLYSADGTPTGRYTDLSIIVTGDVKPLAQDLPKFWGDYGLPPTPVTIVPTGTSDSSTDLSGIGEFDMDTEYSTGMAGGLHHLYLYNGTSLSSSDIDVAINQWVVEDKTQIASMSIGGCEYLNFAEGATAVLDPIFLAGALQGQALFNSTGDEGSACAVVANTGYPVGVQNVEYPSSNPYVVAVGGTSLIPNSDLSYNTEFSWIGGGGGPSLIEAPGPWQFANDVPSALAGRRGLPDIAYPADPELGGAAVYTGGSYQGIGGTSLATPLAAGAWARIMSARGNNAGYPPAEIYRAYRAQNALGNLLPAFAASTLVGGFNDIQFGSNGAYQATPGWDYNTGVGSINVAALEALFDQIGL